MHREGKVGLCVPEACFSKKLTDGLGPQNQEAPLNLLNLKDITLLDYDTTTLWLLIVYYFSLKCIYKLMYFVDQR